jgi:hypothetical protein
MENYVSLTGATMNKPVLKKKNKYFIVLDLLIVDENQKHQMFSVIAFEDVALSINHKVTSKQMVKIEGKLNRQTKISGAGNYHNNIRIVCDEFYVLYDVDENFNPVVQEEEEEKPAKKKLLRDKSGRFVSNKTKS